MSTGIAVSLIYVHVLKGVTWTLRTVMGVRYKREYVISEYVIQISVHYPIESRRDSAAQYVINECTL
jgi:hypothetical protein